MADLVIQFYFQVRYILCATCATYFVNYYDEAFESIAKQYFKKHLLFKVTEFEQLFSSRIKAYEEIMMNEYMDNKDDEIFTEFVMFLSKDFMDMPFTEQTCILGADKVFFIRTEAFSYLSACQKMISNGVIDARNEFPRRNY
jgi:hypothetical protein